MADRWRQAAPHEALEVLLARHRENFSPAEVREVEQAIFALREADTGDMVLVPREPKRGLLCGDVAISTDPRYAGWVFVRHVDGENWTTGAKLTPETWAMLAAADEERSQNV